MEGVMVIQSRAEISGRHWCQTSSCGPKFFCDYPGISHRVVDPIAPGPLWCDKPWGMGPRLLGGVIRAVHEPPLRDMGVNSDGLGVFLREIVGAQFHCAQVSWYRERDSKTTYNPHGLSRRGDWQVARMIRSRNFLASKWARSEILPPQLRRPTRASLRLYSFRHLADSH
jgi:hypothetical protein